MCSPRVGTRLTRCSRDCRRVRQTTRIGPPEAWNMTTARRQRKSRRELIFFLALAAVGLVLAPGRPIFAATTERVVSDPALGPRHRRVRSRGLFHRCRAQARQFRLRAALRRRGLAVPQRGQPRGLHRQPGGLYAAVRRLRSGRGGARRQRRPAMPNCGRSPRSGSICSTARRRATPSPAIPAPRSVPPSGSGRPCCATLSP